MKSKIDVFVMNIADILQQPVDELLPLFSPARSRDILRFKFNADRNRTIWAELLLRSELCKKLSLPFDKIAIERDKNSKPFVRDCSIDISLSHSGDWVACSFGDVPNGVDVEIDSSDALAIAKFYFSSAEYQILCDLDEEKRKIQFLKFWTLKEACFKCIGNITFINDIAGKNFLLDDGAVIGVAASKSFLPDCFHQIPFNAEFGMLNAEFF